MEMKRNIEETLNIIMSSGAIDAKFDGIYHNGKKYYRIMVEYEIKKWHLFKVPEDYDAVLLMEDVEELMM